MISATPQPSLEALSEALTEAAATLATAQAQSRQLEASGSPLRWRTASLVWPLFTASLMKTKG
ncbi:MAG TPA: hypothetical protein VFF98_03520 [Novosphingobium sp.]|nr:hypothetical protein [Novosphingobium sp.]HZV11037.1 hypothetical protein [Novosphingobium sp.]